MGEYFVSFGWKVHAVSRDKAVELAKQNLKPLAEREQTYYLCVWSNIQEISTKMLKNIGAVEEWLKKLGFREEMGGGFSILVETKEDGEVSITAQVKSA